MRDSIFYGLKRKMCFDDHPHDGYPRGGPSFSAI